MRRKRRLPAAFVAVAAGLGGALAVAAPSQAAPVTGAGADPMVTVTASAAPRVPAGAKQSGTVPAGSSLHLVVTLKARNQAGLDAALAGEGTPGSPWYHQFLTPQQFTAMFGATDAQLAAVTGALKAAGLTPGAVSANRLSIQVTGPASAVNSGLHAALTQYKLASGRMAYANKTPPQLPQSAAALVNGIVGLDNLYQQQSMAVVPKGPKAAVRKRAAPSAAGPQACAAAANVPSTLTATELAAHYGMTPLYSLGDQGQGQRVALVEFEPNLASDITAYETCYGISTAVSYVAVDGGAGTGAGVGEAALDIENVAGLAPKAAIDVYQAPNDDAGNYDVYQSIVSADTAKTVSTSWGMCEADDTDSDENALELLFQQAALQGQTVLAAAGDTGSTACLRSDGTDQLNVLTPGSSPYVVSVGGTQVKAGSEVTWNESATSDGAGGGGVSGYWCMPSYQHATAIPGLVNAHSATASKCTANGGYLRQVPDLSADADPASGYAVNYNGAWTDIGGTSGAAPLLAAAAALTDASPFCAAYGATSPGLLPTGLYAMTANDHAYTYPASGFVAEGLSDVTSGSNDYTPSGYTGGLYPAGKGYDQATGLGVPLVSGLNGQAQPSTYYPGLAALMCRQYGTKLLTTTVTGVTPAAGKAGQANTVTVHGTGFLPVAGADVAVIGSTRVPAACASATACTVTLPARGASTIDVRISAGDYAATAITKADQFKFLAVPAVSSVTPASGAAGTKVVIRGTNFTGVKLVTFGGEKAVGAKVVSATEITAAAPAGTGTVNVAVVTASGTSAAVKADQFRYPPAPAVTSVSPAKGPAGGGTKVTIHGTNFSSVKLVQFGSKKAVGAKVVSPTEITAAAPGGAKGTVHVVITTASGANGGTGAASAFTYN